MTIITVMVVSQLIMAWVCLDSEWLEMVLLVMVTHYTLYLKEYGIVPQFLHSGMGAAHTRLGLCPKNPPKAFAFGNRYFFYFYPPSTAARCA